MQFMQQNFFYETHIKDCSESTSEKLERATKIMEGCKGGYENILEAKGGAMKISCSFQEGTMIFVLELWFSKILFTRIWNLS